MPTESNFIGKSTNHLLIPGSALNGGVEMRFFSCFLLATFLTVFSCTTPPAQEAVVDDTAQEEADIAALIKIEEQTFPTAFNASDSEAAMQVFDENTIRMGPGMPAIEGKPAMKAFLDDWLKRNKANLQQKVEEVEICGDWAWLRCSASNEITSLESGKTQKQKGKYIVISRRQSDGSWKTYRVCGNEDHPVPSDND